MQFRRICEIIVDSTRRICEYRHMKNNKSQYIIREPGCTSFAETKSPKKAAKLLAEARSRGLSRAVVVIETADDYGIADDWQADDDGTQVNWHSGVRTYFPFAHR